MSAELPRCPVTGTPAVELLQAMPAKLLFDLWRIGLRVDPAPLRRDSGRIGLYRSACGLAFFHPAFEGSAGFYEGFYGGWGGHEALAIDAARRPDHGAVAELARPGMRVLEVGCGHGLLARRLPAGVAFQGLEPHGDPPPGAPPILAERVEEHAVRAAGTYDIACAFHVLEHVADPRGLAAAMLDCLRPGGWLVLAVPAWPSLLSDLPNNMINLPPHHLTWWNAEALLALAATLGLEGRRRAGCRPRRGGGDGLGATALPGADTARALGEAVLALAPGAGLGLRGRLGNGAGLRLAARHGAGEPAAGRA